MTAGGYLQMHVVELVEIVALLGASAFFSGTETALFNLTRGQLHQLGRMRGSGRVVAALMARPQRTLNTLLLGNLIVNVWYSAVAALMALRLREMDLPPVAAAIALLMPLLGLILFGEVAPKRLAFAIAERWALVTARPLVIVGRVLAAPLWVLEQTLVRPMTRLLAPAPAGSAEISTDELASVLDLSARRGIIDHNANVLLQEIVELTDLRITDVMVPRVDMVAYDVDAAPAGLLERFASTRLRRIPVYEGDVDHVLGLVHAKRLLFHPDAPLRELVVETFFVPESGNLERLLMQFRMKRTQTAIVVDEYGGTAGLVTLQDVLEEIVGDLPEPEDIGQTPPVEKVGPRSYRIRGGLAIHDWADAFKIDLAGKRISTVGGFVTSQLGRIARVGDTATYRNLRFTVESMRGSRIGKLLLELREERP